MSEAVKTWTVPRARSVRELALRRIDEIILGEIERARPRLRGLRESHPEAGRSELVDLLIDGKQSYAGTGGVVSGSLGLAGVPFDLVMVSYLQLSLAVEIAMLYGVNLKSRQAQRDLLHVVASANGVSTVVRGTPLLARFAMMLLRRRGWPTLGRAVPLLASPFAAWMNSRDISRVGAAARRHYDALELMERRRALRRRQG